MPSIPCHILVEGNPIVIYASRNGTPDKVLPLLERFLDTFWQERDLASDTTDTPDCLAAQIVVRFGFEICEDDYSNLKISTRYNPDVAYLYWLTTDRQVQVWLPETAYRENPELGLKGCRRWVSASSPV